jgi:cobalamin biosynthesis Mg chelatase CobN
VTIAPVIEIALETTISCATFEAASPEDQAAFLDANGYNVAFSDSEVVGVKISCGGREIARSGFDVDTHNDTSASRKRDRKSMAEFGPRALRATAETITIELVVSATVLTFTADKAFEEIVTAIVANEIVFTLSGGVTDGSNNDGLNLIILEVSPANSASTTDPNTYVFEVSDDGTVEVVSIAGVMVTTTITTAQAPGVNVTVTAAPKIVEDDDCDDYEEPKGKSAKKEAKKAAKEAKKAAKEAKTGKAAKEPKDSKKSKKTKAKKGKKCAKVKAPKGVKTTKVKAPKKAKEAKDAKAGKAAKDAKKAAKDAKKAAKDAKKKGQNASAKMLTQNSAGKKARNIVVSFAMVGVALAAVVGILYNKRRKSASHYEVMIKDETSPLVPQGLEITHALGSEFPSSVSVDE